MPRAMILLLTFFTAIVMICPSPTEGYCNPPRPPAFEKIYIRSPCEVLFTPYDKFYRSPCGTLRPFEKCGTDCYGYYILIINSVCPNCGKTHRGNQPIEGYSCDQWEAPKQQKPSFTPPVPCPTGVPGGLPLLNLQPEIRPTQEPTPSPLIRSNTSNPVLTPLETPNNPPPPLNRSPIQAPVLTPNPAPSATPQQSPEQTPEAPGPVLKRGYA
jgi:hypothetical protein